LWLIGLVVTTTTSSLFGFVSAQTHLIRSNQDHFGGEKLKATRLHPKQPSVRQAVSSVISWLPAIKLDAASILSRRKPISMKTVALSLTLIAGPFVAFSSENSRNADACQSSSPSAGTSARSADIPTDFATRNAPVSHSMKISVGKHVFTATLYDNATADAFKARLPLSLEMRDVNSNEKAFELSSDLPTADTNPRTIRTGDLMIWDSHTVVVFYKSFTTPYRYTKLGHIENPVGLVEALGAGNVTVTFELK
jgi:hypothetical protein